MLRCTSPKPPGSLQSTRITPSIECSGPDPPERFLRWRCEYRTGFASIRDPLLHDSWLVPSPCAAERFWFEARFTATSLMTVPATSSHLNVGQFIRSLLPLPLTPRF